MRMAVTGAAGRMGRTLVRMINEADDLTLAAALECKDSELLGADAGEVAGIGALGIPIIEDITAALPQFDILIDFSVPEATLHALHACREGAKKIVVGTTGFDATGQSLIDAASADIAILQAPNMSIGVNLCFRLVEIAARALGDDVDVEVMEIHHRDKIDAPSGTAVRMGEILAEALDRDLAKDAIYGREGVTGPRDRRTIGFATLRGGDIVGEHSVIYAGAGERIEITHRAQSRDNFAQGALRAARFLRTQQSGLFDMQDVLGPLTG